MDKAGASADSIDVRFKSNDEQNIFEDKAGRVLRTGIPYILDHTKHLFLAGHISEITAITVTHDGRTAVSGSKDGTVMAWDLRNRKNVCEALAGHTDAVTSVSISSDGATAASGSLDRTIRIWNLRTGHQSVLISLRTGHLTCGPFSNDGRHLVTVSDERFIRIFDTVCTEKASPLQLKHEGRLLCVRFIRGDSHLVSVAEDEKVIIWDTIPISEGRKVLSYAPKDVREIPGLKRGNIPSVKVSADGSRIFSASTDGHMNIYEYVEKAKTYSWTLSFTQMDHLWAGMSADGTRIVHGSGLSILVRTLDDPPKMARIRMPRSVGFSSVCMSEGGDFVVFGFRDGLVGVSNVSNVPSLQKGELRRQLAHALRRSRRRASRNRPPTDAVKTEDLTQDQTPKKVKPNGEENLTLVQHGRSHKVGNSVPPYRTPNVSLAELVEYVMLGNEIQLYEEDLSLFKEFDFPDEVSFDSHHDQMTYLGILIGNFDEVTPSEVSKYIAQFRLSHSNETVTIDVRHLSPAGFSLLIWILTPSPELVGFVLAIMRETKFKNCFVEEVLHENRQGNSQYVVVPRAWFYWLGVTDEFACTHKKEHSGGFLGICVGNPAKKDSIVTRIAFKMAVFERRARKTDRELGQVFLPSEERSEQVLLIPKERQGSSDGNISDNISTYQLIYQPAVPKHIELNGLSIGFQVASTGPVAGATWNLSPEFEEYRRNCIKGFTVPIESFAMYLRIPLQDRRNSPILRRVGRLGEICSRGVFPYGHNRGFLEAVLKDQKCYDEIRMFNNLDCKVPKDVLRSNNIRGTGTCNGGEEHVLYFMEGDGENSMTASVTGYFDETEKYIKIMDFQGNTQLPKNVLHYESFIWSKRIFDSRYFKYCTITLLKLKNLFYTVKTVTVCGSLPFETAVRS